MKRMTTANDAPAAQALASTIVEVIKSFCSEGSYHQDSHQPGTFDADLYNSVRQSIRFTVFDGAPYAQLTGRLLCREQFTNALASEKDNFHDFMRIIEEAAKKDKHWGPIRAQLIAKKHSIVKDCHYAATTKEIWHRCQQTIIDRRGHQSGNGSQQVKTIIKHMPYCPTRAGAEADCFL